MKKTKIICTIGPTTESEEILTKLLHAGMDVMRLNFSHGNYLEHNRRIINMRKVIQKTGCQVAILLDTKGPEIRTMKLQDSKEVLLKKGQLFTLSTDQSLIGNSKCVAVTYSGLVNDLTIGNKILVDDGLICMQVIELTKKTVICQVLNSGTLSENKGINLPGVNVQLPALAEKDKHDLIFGCQQKVDFIAASFIRKHSDVLEIRNFLNKNGGENIQIIAKIENQEGLNNFSEILKVADGIMVARGDLGVEIPIAEVIFAQKMMIKECNKARKVVITATQMLDSMIEYPRPTRAEAGDVANAIIDGTDAVMLSGESAKGKYPIECVKIMASICKRTDDFMNTKINNIDYSCNDQLSITEAIGSCVVETAEKLLAPIIIVKTSTGKSVKTIRKYFPRSLIIALTNNEIISRQLILSRGIKTHLVSQIKSIDDFYYIGKKIAVKFGYAKKGDTILMVVSEKITSNGPSRNFSIHII